MARGQIIAVANQKGGSGKTTISMHLAALAHEQGQEVAIADADPQQSASRWGADAPDEFPWPTPILGISSAKSSAHRHLRELSGKYDLVIVDCPPSADAETTQSIFLVADKVLVPVLPSGTDIQAVDRIIQLADQARALRENNGEEGEVLPLRIVLNQFSRKRILGRETLDYLAEIATVLRSTVPQREAYRQASAESGTGWGGSVKNPETKHDFKKLMRELMG